MRTVNLRSFQRMKVAAILELEYHGPLVPYTAFIRRLALIAQVLLLFDDTGNDASHAPISNLDVMCSGQDLALYYSLQCLLFFIGSRSKIYHQWVLLPQSIRPLVQPPRALRRKLHVEIIHDASENQSHLRICQATTHVSVSSLLGIKVELDVVWIKTIREKAVCQR